jgi:hypothetical protein
MSPSLDILMVEKNASKKYDKEKLGEKLLGFHPAKVQSARPQDLLIQL